jgi:hypothetical protein
MRHLLIFTLLLSLILASCTRDKKFGDDDLNSFSTKSKLLIGEEYFNNFPKDPAKILSASITGDSLTITFGASCCSGNTWIVNLVGNEKVLYSDPPQREVRLSLKNDEFCDAYCTRIVKFDITPARLTGTNRIILNLSGWGSQLIYDY